MGGGTVIITGANLQSLQGLLGVSVSGACEELVPAGTTVTHGDGTSHTEPRSFKLCSLRLPANATVLASISGGDSAPAGYEQFESASGRRHYYNQHTGHVISETRPIVVAVALPNGGRLVVLAAPFGLSDELSSQKKTRDLHESCNPKCTRLYYLDSRRLMGDARVLLCQCRRSSWRGGRAGGPGPAALITTPSLATITRCRHLTRC